MTAKQIAEEISSELDIFNHYVREGDDFYALEILFDKFYELKEHYNIHHLKDINFDLDYCKEIAKNNDITNVKDGLKC